MGVMIGIDPHKGSHTAVALDDREEPLDELRVRSGMNQVEQLVTWAAPFVERTWAIEGAGGLGYLLAQQLVAGGERVVDVVVLALGTLACGPNVVERVVEQLKPVLAVSAAHPVPRSV